jgi:hypothetical protein
MKLTRAKKVFQQRGQAIIKKFVTQDSKKIITETIADLVVLSKKNNRNLSLPRITELKHTLRDTALLLKVIPQRMRFGLNLFMHEFLTEMSSLSDQKSRTVYSMKVIAALSKMAFASAYEVGTGPKLLVMGKSARSAYSGIVFSRILYRSVQVFLIRFIEEVEKDTVDPQELAQLDSFKRTILDDEGNAIDKLFAGIVDPEDKAFALVDKFRNYIFTGELLDRETEKS